MKIRYICSACVVVEHGGVQVLCDPWLTDGIYYGSWFHYPPLTFAPADFSKADYIYISHVHPDHLDMATLEQLPRSIPILILDYADKFVLRILKGLGFDRVHEVPHGESASLGKDFSIKIFAADNCDAIRFEKFFNCVAPKPYMRTIQLDSLAVFCGGGKTVVNANDCPYDLAAEVCDVVLDSHGRVDFAMVGYGGAGEYPQCFENLDEGQKRERAMAKREQFLAQAVKFLERLRPTRFMPFAGQYTLGGRLSKLNQFKGVPELEELPSEFPPLLQRSGVECDMVLLNSGDWFDVEKGRASAPFIPPSPNERRRYIDEYLSLKKFPYEEEYRVDQADWADLMPQLREAQTRLRRHQVSLGYSSEWRVYLDAGQGYLYCVSFDGSLVERVEHGKEREPFAKISIDYSLLQMLLNRKAHWNNATIGSHLRFYRQPDVYERSIYELLSFLHC